MSIGKVSRFLCSPYRLYTHRAMHHLPFSLLFSISFFKHKNNREFHDEMQEPGFNPTKRVYVFGHSSDMHRRTSEELRLCDVTMTTWFNNQRKGMERLSSLELYKSATASCVKRVLLDLHSCLCTRILTEHNA